MIPEMTNQMIIGDYTITQYSDGKTWIVHKSKEGGEFSVEALNKMFYHFFYINL